MKYLFIIFILTTQNSFATTTSEILSISSHTSIHSTTVSKYADPMNAFLSSFFMDKEIFIESKFGAGIKDKLQDDHTRSSLYKEYRSEFQNRGIYQEIKAKNEISDNLAAKSEAVTIYKNFLKSLVTNDTVDDFFQNKVLDDEVFNNSLDQNEFAVMMEANKESILNSNNEAFYIGFLPAHAIHSIKLLNSDLSIHKLIHNNKPVVLFIESNDCLYNTGLDFYECRSGAGVDLSSLKLAGLASLVQDQIDLEELKNQFSNFTQKGIKKAISEIKMYSNDKLDFFIPMVPVRNDSVSSSLLDNDAKYDDINTIVKADYKYQKEDIKHIYYVPSKETKLGVNYEFDNELKLNPGEVIYLNVPKHNKAISNIILGHHQNPKDQRGSMSYNSRTGVKTYDNWPAYTSVQVHSLNHRYGLAWRGWAGHVSGEKRSKFAEIKKSPEFDNLYEWPLKGHVSIESKQKEISLLYTNLLKIEVLGDDPVYISDVQVKFVPPMSSHYEEKSYTHDQTIFGHPTTMQGRRYGGGGNRYYGKFPGAVKLSPSRWSNDDELVIDTHGRDVESIDIAVGDTKPDGVRNRDGGYGSLGGAKISIYVVTVNGRKHRLIDEENVGPQGVISTFSDYGPLDKIIIDVNDDSAYIMAHRYGYK